MYYCAADRFLLFSFYYNFSLPSPLFSPLSCTLLFLAINTAHTHTNGERRGGREREEGRVRVGWDEELPTNR